MLSIGLEASSVIYKGKKMIDRFFPSDLYAKPHFLYYVKLYTEEDQVEHEKVMEMVAKVREVVSHSYRSQRVKDSSLTSLSP